MMDNGLVENDPLNFLKEFTAARIALGRVGSSVPLKASLEFKLAHAHARDAVYSILALDELTARLKGFGVPVLHLQSKAETRVKYLKRPDLGRRLNAASITLLKEYNSVADIAIIVADGLSATAINEHIPGILRLLLPLFAGAKLKLTPVCIVEQGRVAIGDDIGYHLNARLCIVFIGERPGLSSADSVGAYLTFDPKPGLTDESRNCISNIRPEGLTFKVAADKIFYLVQEAFKRELSGVALKDNAGLLS